MIGTILKLVSGVVSLAGKIMDAFRDKKLRDEGATEQRAATDEATLDTIKRVDAPIAQSESDELWNRNKAKFGVIDGGAGKAG